MNRPILPLPGHETPDGANVTHGEGAQSALAAMIRRRQMGENHVEVESERVPLTPPASDV